MRQAQPESQRLSAQQAAEPQPAWMGWPRCNWSAPTTPSSPGACPLSSHFDAHPVRMRVESTWAYVYTVRLLALVFGQGERANSCRPILSPHLFNPTAIRRSGQSHLSYQRSELGNGAPAA